MSTEKNDTSSSIVYSIVAGAICCYFVPRYTIYFVLGGVICVCTYGIIRVLKKYENISDMNFLEREKVEHFKNKK